MGATLQVVPYSEMLTDVYQDAQYNNHNKPKWKKTTKKCISWISRDGDRLIKCAETFKKKIGKKHSFKKFMNKLKSSIDENLRRRKVIKLAGKGQVKLISAPWVDTELIDNIKLRTCLNKT